jgi:alpha-methylacyl-CoA racemase
MALVQRDPVSGAIASPQDPHNPDSASVIIERMTIELGQGSGPLRGVKVVEIAGIGPGPHACMILADLGADVIRVERPGGQALAGGGSHMLLNRGRPSVALDLKNPAAIETVKRLVEQADVLVEGMRPGVMERLGLGPADLYAVNERLVYGRMTGWGQDGPLAQAAGHDMNYIAITGALFGLGQDKSRPHFPTNLVGDFGGGSTYLVIGILAALLEATRSGQGQVVDAAIVDGTAHLNAMTAAFHASGGYREERAANLLDGGAAYYDIYETSDGLHMSVGALEPQFYDVFVDLLGIKDAAPDRYDPANNDALRAMVTEAFQQRTQVEWIDVFEGTDACVAGILPLTRAFEHPHLKARGTFVEKDGHTQPAPAPRFSRTQASIGRPAESAGDSTREALGAWGIDGVDDLIASGAAVQA